MSGGIATFTNLFDTKAETMTLVFTAAGLPKVASGTITISPAAAATLSVDAPISVAPGSRFTITVTALDPYGNVAIGYQGAVRFTSPDKQASLPRDYRFTAMDQGVHLFRNGVTLRTAGSQTIRVADIATPSITRIVAIQVSGTRGSSLPAMARTETHHGKTFVANHKGERRMSGPRTRVALGHRPGLANGRT